MVNQVEMFDFLRKEMEVGGFVRSDILLVRQRIMYEKIEQELM